MYLQPTTRIKENLEVIIEVSYRYIESLHLYSTLHLLFPESQLEKASQTLTSLLPEYAVMDPRDDYTDGWIFLPREEKKVF
jgi:hypothetical protein